MANDAGRVLAARNVHALPARLASLAAVGAICVLLAVGFFNEGDRRMHSRLYQVKTDMAGLSAAVKQFKRDTGRLPVALADLSSTQAGLHAPVNVPSPPWGGSYQYALDSRAAEGFNVWVNLEDPERRKLHASLISIHFDWAAAGVD